MQADLYIELGLPQQQLVDGTVEGMSWVSQHQAGFGSKTCDDIWQPLEGLLQRAHQGVEQQLHLPQVFGAVRCQGCQEEPQGFICNSPAGVRAQNQAAMRGMDPGADQRSTKQPFECLQPLLIRVARNYLVLR